jgi:beta-galactosidase GanA
MKEHQILRADSSYYPERWPQARWAEDVRLIKESGMDFIHTGEFAWSTFERNDGAFDFAWMERLPYSGCTCQASRYDADYGGGEAVPA